jgi:hypothetical protein
VSEFVERLTPEQRRRYASAFVVAAEFGPPMSLEEFIDYHLLNDPELELRFWQAELSLFADLSSRRHLSPAERRLLWDAIHTVAEFGGQWVPDYENLRLPEAVGVESAEQLCSLFRVSFGVAGSNAEQGVPADQPFA